MQTMHERGQQLRLGLGEQAVNWGLTIRQTGPPEMPFLTFDGDVDLRMSNVFAAHAIRRGLYLQPRHNWFISAAMTERDVADALEITDEAFGMVVEQGPILTAASPGAHGGNDGK